jgi:predicted ribosomally synthesized peptide with SipW-like signal peptide
MRPYILAVFTAALFALPTSAAFSQVDVEVGPGGVRVGPGYHRHYYNRSDEGGRCQELRQACVHKGQLGEEGMGNCRRYRTMCR